MEKTNPHQISISHLQMDFFSNLDFSHSRRNSFRSVHIDFSIIKSDKSKGLVFGLTGINYGKSHERKCEKGHRIPW